MSDFGDALDFVKSARQQGGHSDTDIAKSLQDGGWTPDDVHQLMGPRPIDNPGSGLAMGIAQGAATTGANIWDLVRKVPGLSSHMPASTPLRQWFERQTADTPTSSGLGRGIEQAAEFLGPQEAVSGALKGAPLLLKLLGAGATSAAVSAAHNPSDPKQMGIDALLGMGGEGIGASAERLAQGLKVGSPDWYLHKLSLPSSISLADRQGVARIGLEGKFIPGSKAAVDSIGGVTKPGTVLGDLNDAVDQAMNRQMPTPPAVAIPGQMNTTRAGQQKINIQQAFKPLTDYIDSLRDSQGRLINGTIEGRAYADRMDQQLKSLVTEWGGQFDTNGNMIKAPDLTVQDAHQFKRGLYKQIEDGMYSDTKDQAAIGASKRAAMLAAQGLKNEVNRLVPEVAPLNEAMHHTIILRDALEDALKSNPSKMGEALQWALGFGLAGHAVTGGPIGASTAGLVALAARRALIDPGTASRLAIVFHDRPGIISAIGGLAKAGIWGGRQALQSGEDSGSSPNGGVGNQNLQQMFNPTVQK